MNADTSSTETLGKENHSEFGTRLPMPQPHLDGAEPQPQSDEDGDDLSVEQLQELLAQAAKRLRNRDATSLTAQDKQAQVQTHFPRLNTGGIAKPYISTKGDVAQADSKRLLREKDREASGQTRKIEDPVAVRKKLVENKRATTGESWYNLPKTDLTPELKRDLQLLHMRNVLDPQRHYKKTNGKLKAPEYSQVGTVIEGATEFFTGRIQNKDRKRTLVEEVLAGEQETGRFKNKYNEVQTKKTSGKKAFYKELKAKRSVGVKKR